MSIDFTIVVLYLIFTLAIGLWKGKNVKNIREYSVANKSFPTLVLMATIFATLIGGGATLGVIEQIHSTSLIFGLIFVGQIIQKLIIIKFVAPKFGKFLNKISCGGIVGDMYGENAKIITGICAFLASAGAIAAQISAMGYVFQFFLGIDQVTGIFIAAGIVILYSTFGGMSSVVATDVFQFGILIIAIPLICNLGLTKVGGYQNLLIKVPTRYFEIPSKEIFYTHVLPLFIYLSIPFEALMTQRLLIAKNVSQMKSSLKIGVLIEIPFVLVIAVIGLLGVVLFPDIESRLVMPTLINDLLPVGVRGFAMAGILAVIMSTADSNLNTASVSLIHDTIKPLVNVKNELALARFVTLIIGIISIVIAVSFSNVISILAAILGIWSSTILIPMFVGLLGVKISNKGFFVALAVGVTCHTLGEFYFSKTYAWMNGFLLGLIGNSLSVLLFWLLGKRNKRSRYTRYTIYKYLKTIISYIAVALSSIPSLFQYMISRYSKDRVEAYGSHYVLFGAFAVINYLIPVFMWESAIPERFYLLISIMRIIAGVLCFFLVINQIWPKKLRRYLPQYWHITLLYSLSFMSVFMLLLNSSSFASVINLAIALFFLVLVVDWISFILLFCLGTLLAVMSYNFMAVSNVGIADINISNEMIYLYVFTILIGGLFSGNKDLIQKKIIATKDQMNKTLKSIVETRTAHLQDALNVKKEVLNNLSHEVRTPLQGIIGVSKELSSSWHKMDDKERYKYVSIMANSGDRLMNLVSDILDLSKFEYGKMVFDMNPNIDIYKIVQTVTDRLEAFILSEKKKINVKIIVKDNINVGVTCDKIKITQLFTNLLNNAVRYIKKEGDIEITLYADKNNLFIRVEDNGIGIPEGEEEDIFGAFSRSSKTKNQSGGAGFGLALCRQIVKAHKGDIRAKSKKSKGSIFIVSLPYGKSKKIIFNEKNYVNEEEKITNVIDEISKKKVLLIDDEEICLESGGMILEALGYIVFKASNKTQALQYLKDNTIDVILLDLMMPDIYGLDLLKNLKKDPNTKNIPVVIQSGISDAQEMKESFDLGAVGFIKKPYKRSEIEKHINKALK